MSFERVILTNLVYNETYTRAVLPHLQADYFGGDSEQFVFGIIRDFVMKYNVPPTKEALAITISNSNLVEGKYEETLDIIKSLEKDEENHLKWLIDETERHCKDKALYNAMSKALDVADGNSKEMDKGAIPGLIMEALSVSFNTSIGHDYWEDAERHWQEMHSDEARHPFSLNILNKVTKGGIKDKTLNVVLAPINGGKSIHLIQQAADWLVRGKNVLYISMEMDERTCRERVDTTALDMTFDQVFALEKQQYLNRVNDLKRKTQGKLMVKEFPAGSAHVGHFRHLLQELWIKKRFKPDLICVDYLTICASSKLPPSAKGNTNTYFTSVAEELRAFAQETGIPIWTAVQLDRASQGSADAGIGNVGLAIGVAATADFMFAVLIPEELAALGKVIGKIIKNRYSSYKSKFLLGLNPEKQQYYEVEQSAGLNEDELTQLGLPVTVPEGTQIITRTVNDATAKATEGWSFN